MAEDISRRLEQSMPQSQHPSSEASAPQTFEASSPSPVEVFCNKQPTSGLHQKRSHVTHRSS